MIRRCLAREALIDHLIEPKAVCNKGINLHAPVGQEVNSSREVFVVDVGERADHLLFRRNQGSEVDGARMGGQAHEDDTAAAPRHRESSGHGGDTPATLNRQIGPRTACDLAHHR